MKKVYFTILATVLCFTSFSQYVAEKQTALVVEKTATWCNPCGTWGWDLFQEIWDEVESETVILVMHDSPASKLYNQAAANFHTLHQQKSSTPVFYTNLMNRTEYAQNGGIYPGITKTNVLSDVSTTNAEAPIVNSGFTQSLSGNTMTIDTKVKYFQNTTGEYYLGVYVTEDNVKEIQNGHSGLANHKRVLRASAYATAGGTLISSGAVSAGDEFTASHTIELDPSWKKDDIKVFTVIYQKVGPRFKYINANKTQGFLSVDKLNKNEFDVKLYPNVASGDQDIMLEIKGSSNETVSIEVYSQIGQKISNIFNGQLKSDQESFNVNPTNSLPKGIYFVNITSDNNLSKTIKMIVG